MKRIEKTVFISYRRTNSGWAQAVFQNLTQHGYDVFFDFTGIGSGGFERVILENIRSRAHFVLLTPSALERCGEPADWLRREIETAIETKRNIIPIMLEGFDFSTSSIANQLTGKLATLKSYNGLQVPRAYFIDAMHRLREHYLNVPLEMVLHPASASAQEGAKAQKAAANEAPLVKPDESIVEEKQKERDPLQQEAESRLLEVEARRNAEEEPVREQERKSDVHEMTRWLGLSKQSWSKIGVALIAMMLVGLGVQCYKSGKFSIQRDEVYDPAAGQALRAFVNEPGLPQYVVDARFGKIRQAYKEVGGPDPEAFVVGAFIVDERPGTKFWQLKVARFLGLIP